MRLERQGLSDKKPPLAAESWPRTSTAMFPAQQWPRFSSAAEGGAGKVKIATMAMFQDGFLRNSLLLLPSPSPTMFIDSP